MLTVKLERIFDKESEMLTDAEIAGYMGWRGPGAYTENKMRKVKSAISEAVAREREACAKVCDTGGEIFATGPERYAAKKCAFAIRGRSNGSGKPTAL